MKTYDHIILGTGQAAGTLLEKLIETGDSIAVIEESKIGGSCVNFGCTPTKALVASARAIHMAGRGDEFGFKAGKVAVNYSAITKRMNTIREKSRKGLKNWIEQTDTIDLYTKKGRFVNENTLEADGVQLQGKHIYINTGTRPRIPEIEGIKQIDYLDSGKLLDLDKLPEHLLIVGGGYIGVEYAQIYRRFGAKVTLIQRSSQLMPREDEEIASGIHDLLTDEGVTIYYNAKATQVTPSGGGIKLYIDQDGKEKVISGSHLLLAVGRIPNSSSIGLKHTHIKTDDKGYIQVDDYCRTDQAGVFALGDVNGEGAFTHTSVNDAEIVLDFLFEGSRSISQRIPIYSLFTDPPLGRVGMSEKEALKSCSNVLKATRPFSEIGRAKEMSETRGMAKLLVDGDTDMILGAAIFGINGDEVINMFAAIMHSGIACRNYRKVVLVHPTISELMPFILDGIKKAGESKESEND